MQTPTNSGIAIKEQAPIRSGLVIKEQIPSKPAIVIKEQTPINSGVIIKEPVHAFSGVEVKEQSSVTPSSLKVEEVKEQSLLKTDYIKTELIKDTPSIQKKKWIALAIISSTVVLMLVFLKVFSLFPDFSRISEDIRDNDKQVVMEDDTVPEVASTPQETVTIAQSEEHPNTAIYEDEIRKMLNKWRESWQSGDMETYRSCYDKTYFESKGMNLDAWVSYKENMYKKNKSVNISIDNLQISADENIATVMFTQHYVSSILKDSGEKTLELRKINNEWKIYREISSSNGVSVVAFEKGLSNEQKVAAVLITNAIRSGNDQQLSKYTKTAEEAKSIIMWWNSADELSNIKFKVRISDATMFLQDNSSGMYTCDVPKDGNHFIIKQEDCIFNDGQ